jgi:hypothetical protein
MRRIVPSTLAIAIAIAMGVPGAARGAEAGPCALPLVAGESVAHRMKRLIRCATDRWEVFGGYEKAVCIAKRESGLNPKAVSKDGRYLGLYQHRRRYWPDRYRRYARPEWNLSESALVGRTAAIVTIRMVRRGGWDPWRGKGCAVRPR